MFRKHYLRAIEYGITASSRSIGFLLKLPDMKSACVLMNSGMLLDEQSTSTHDLRNLYTEILQKIPTLDINLDELEELPKSFEHFTGFVDVALAEVIYESARQVKSLAVLMDLIAATKLLAPLLRDQNTGNPGDVIQKKLEGKVGLMASMYKPHLLPSPKGIGDVAERLKQDLSGVPSILQDILVERAGELTYHQLTKNRHPNSKPLDDCAP